MPEVVKLIHKLPEMITELDEDLKKEQARAKRIVSAANCFKESMVYIRANKLSAIRQISDLLITMTKPNTKSN